METSSGLRRLHQQQQSLLRGIDDRLSHLRQMQNDLEAVDRLLADLPTRLAHRSLMLPFAGRKALVRGDLVDTNEALVFLGADHFASMSMHQARGVARRRAEAVAVQVAACAEERRLVDERRSATAGLMREVAVGEVEDETAAAAWQERHARLLRNRQRPERCADEEAACLRRLEELERQEEKEEEEEEEEERPPGILSSRREPAPRPQRRVRFSFDEEEEKEEEEEEEEEARTSAVIAFRHSAVEAADTDDWTPASVVACARRTACDVTAAVGDVVVERREEDVTAAATRTSERPVSRFRAQRMGRKT